MKPLFATLVLLAGLAQAQIVTPSGRGAWGDSVRWGDSDDSTSYYNFRGNTMYRDSSSTWVSTADSCSRPVVIARGGQYPEGKLEYSYEVRGSAGNTDSTQVKWRADTRYCKDERRSLGCESWVPAGRWKGDTASVITDSLVSVATTSGTTWKPTRQIFDVPGGNQIRLCVDSYRAGGATGDTTFFRNHIVRTSSIPAGGTPPSSTTIDGEGLSLSGSVAVTSIAAGDNNIGNVDVASLSGVSGVSAHDAAVSGAPLLTGGAASAAAPTSVSADGDAVQSWYLRNGAQATVITAAGALVGGDATNGLDVDVTRLPALVAGTANIGDVDVLTVPTDPFGANADAASATGSFSAKLRFIASTGIPITSSALPTGAATAAKQPALGTAGTASADVITVQGIASGTAMPISAAALPLPALAATSTKQSDGTQKTQIVDGSGNVITSTSNNLNVQCANCSGSGASATDAASFTASTSTMAPAGAFYQTTATANALTNGTQGMLQATAQRALFVNLRDASGAEVSVGGGTQYDDDAVYGGDGSKVTVAGVVRRDANTTLAASDGDVAPLQVNAAGQLKTEVIASALPSGAATAAKQPALGTAGTASADVITVQGIASGTPLAVSDNSGSLTVDYATTGSGTATGALRVELPTNGTGVIATVGAVTAITNALPAGSNVIGALTANQSVNVAQINGVTPLMGAGATGTGSHRVTIATDGQGQVVDNAGFTDGTTRLDMAGFIFDEVAGTSLTENDAAAARVDSKRALVFALEDATTRGQRQAVSSGGAAEIHGDVAHDAPIGGNPVRIGLRAATADYTAVATGDQADVLGTIDGKIVTKPHAIRASTWTYAAASGGITNTTAATIKAAAASGFRNCLTSIQVINGHATVSTEVLVRDGGGGTVVHRGWAQAAGGGFAANFDVPICGTAATLMEVVPVTTGSAIYVNAQGYISQE